MQYFSFCVWLIFSRFIHGLQYLRGMPVYTTISFLFFLFLNLNFFLNFIVVQLQLSAFSSHPSTPPQPNFLKIVFQVQLSPFSSHHSPPPHRLPPPTLHPTRLPQLLYPFTRGWTPRSFPLLPVVSNTAVNGHCSLCLRAPCLCASTGPQALVCSLVCGLCFPLSCFPLWSS